MHLVGFIIRTYSRILVGWTLISNLLYAELIEREGVTNYSQGMISFFYIRQTFRFRNVIVVPNDVELVPCISLTKRDKHESRFSSIIARPFQHL